jgi:peptide-methionine (S)-S-oxide reductase
MIIEATFGAGCFWCVETCFKDIKGVLTVTAGFCGGDPERSSYEEVCSGTTGHAEVARVQFDDSIVTFDKLLEMFWYAHDPTQLNRQGNDIGSHYRSVIFYHSDEQKDKAQFAMSEFTRNEIWPKPVVTEISPVSTFFPADDYHKDYYSKNSDNMYCNLVLRPKVEKFKEVFRDLLK